MTDPALARIRSSIFIICQLDRTDQPRLAWRAISTLRLRVCRIAMCGVCDTWGCHRPDEKKTHIHTLCRCDASGLENITKNINTYEQVTNSAFTWEGVGGGGGLVNYWAPVSAAALTPARMHAHRGRLRTTTFLNYTWPI